MTEENNHQQEATPAQDAEKTTGQLDGAQAAEPNAEESAASKISDEGHDAQEEDPRSPYQKRIDGLYGNWQDAKRDRDYWRDLAMQNMQQAKPGDNPEATPATPAPAIEKPKADGYDSYEAYLEALTDWKVEQRVAAQQQELTTATQQRQQEQQQQVFQQRVQSFRVEIPDFDAVAFNPALRVSETMASVIRESDDGPKLLYHLGKNPQDAARIAGLSPYAAARELGKIEALLSIPAPKKTTNAPPPINTLNGGGETVTTDPDKMSADQWLQWRNKQLQGK